MLADTIRALSHALNRNHPASIVQSQGLHKRMAVSALAPILQDLTFLWVLFAPTEDLGAQECSPYRFRNPGNRFHTLMKIFEA
jgi:hypothetical protein